MVIEPVLIRRKHRTDTIFIDEFEEKKCIEYILNCYRTPLGRKKARQMLTAAILITGTELGVQIIKKFLRRGLDDEEIEELRDINELPSWITSQKAFSVLKKGCVPVLETLHKEARRHQPSDTEERILTLKNLFDLNSTETELLSLFYLRTVSAVVEYLFDEAIDFSRVDLCRNFVGFLIGKGKEEVRQALRSGRLFDGYLLELEDRNIHLSEGIQNYISGIGNDDIGAEFFEVFRGDTIPIREFSVPEEEMSLLVTLLEISRGCNLLFYGAPGTGKTSFARSLARHLNKDLYVVKHPQDDDPASLMRAIYATENICPPSGVVLIDEADDVLNTAGIFPFFNRSSKGWINSFMDRSRKKIIWITNRIRGIDPSTKRRFTFSMEFKPLSARQRKRVLLYELERAGCKRFLSSESIKKVCSEFPLDASAIVDAVRTVSEKSDTEDERIEGLRIILRSKHNLNTEKQHSVHKTTGFYSIEGLNLSIPPETLLDRITTFYQKIEEGINEIPGLCLLFYGSPGTGKTAFAKYLGKHFERDVIIKRGSDILSMWVGETEKGIALSFEEAERREGILFFDEADSFLYPRSDAQHSWETTSTNELLTWMEDFRGLVIFATNQMEGLDHAAMRRFTYKVEFRELEPEGVVIFYRGLLEGLAGQPLSAEDEGRLRGIRGLTPGDFETVRRRYIYETPGGVSNDELITALTEELSYRKKGRRKIGFR